MSIKIPANLVDRSRLYEEISHHYMAELIHNTGPEVMVLDDECFAKRCLTTADGDMERLGQAFAEAEPRQVAAWLFAYLAIAARNAAMDRETFHKVRERGHALMERAGLVLTVVENHGQRNRRDTDGQEVS